MSAVDGRKKGRVFNLTSHYEYFTTNLYILQHKFLFSLWKNHYFFHSGFSGDRNQAFRPSYYIFIGNVCPNFVAFLNSLSLPRRPAPPNSPPQRALQPLRQNPFYLYFTEFPAFSGSRSGSKASPPIASRRSAVTVIPYAPNIRLTWWYIPCRRTTRAVRGRPGRARGERACTSSRRGRLPPRTPRQAPAPPACPAARYRFWARGSWARGCGGQTPRRR